MFSNTVSVKMILMRSRWKILAVTWFAVVSFVGIYHMTYISSTISYSSNNERQYYEFLEQFDYNNSNTMDLPEVNQTVDYELTLHRLHEQIQDLWYYASHEIMNVIVENNNKKLNKTLQTLLTNLESRKSSLLGEQQRLRSVDGRSEMREQEAAIASELVQRRLRELHNPHDCKAARKIICFLNYNCGFGCHVHHIAYCLKVAYLTTGLVILNSNVWNYNRHWSNLFEPLSEKCFGVHYDLKEAAIWPLTGSDKAQLVYVRQEPYIPLGVPEDLANRVTSFNSDPASWFIGQIMKYILRPRPTFQKIIDNVIARINYQHPVVGVHVRRTDKLIWEAKFHALQEYMQHAKEYWLAQDVARRPGTPSTPRRVYLACDDVNVFKEARRMYPGVEFIGDQNIASSASVKNRRNADSLTGFVVDLILLSRANFLVCTFSSNVGRAAYELMQTNRVDASESCVSLDDKYNFYGNYRLLAKQRHQAQRPEEMSFEIGDLIMFHSGNDFNGYGRGEVIFKNRTGLFPWHKVEHHPVLYNSSNYQDWLQK